MGQPRCTLELQKEISQSFCLQEAHCLRDEINNKIYNHRTPEKCSLSLAILGAWVLREEKRTLGSGKTWGEVTL